MTIACAALATDSASDLAQKYQISRQYVYELKSLVSDLKSNSDSAASMLYQRFFPDQQIIVADDSLFEKMVLSLALDGTSSIEGIQRVLENVFHHHISTGSISAILNRAADRAEEFDRSVDLSNICQGANDEIFQCRTPVLTGIDPESTYIYLLEEAPDRSADSWDAAMRTCKNRNLNLEVSISDFGTGLLAGIPKAFPEIQFQGDLFHWLMELGKEISSRERKTYALLSDYEQKLEALSGERVHEKTFQRLLLLEEELGPAIETSDQLHCLYQWLREMTQPQGYSCQEVETLCLWILEQMETVGRAAKPFRNVLKKTRAHLPHVLYFLKRTEEILRDCSRKRGYPEETYLFLYRLQQYPSDSVEYKAIYRRLSHILKSHLAEAYLEVQSILSHVKRASSMVENLNGRLRRYMNLKRMVPKKFLTLLKVYFNTRRYRRSRKTERVGKSPLELLTGQPHPDFYDIILSR